MIHPLINNVITVCYERIRQCFGVLLAVLSTALRPSCRITFRASQAENHQGEGNQNPPQIRTALKTPPEHERLVRTNKVEIVANQHTVLMPKADVRENVEHYITKYRGLQLGH